MAKSGIAVKKTRTIFGEMERLHQAISHRAYDLFQSGSWGGPLSHWLTAERQLISKPAVELRQRDDQFELLVALPGIEAKELDVQITPADLLIKAEVTHEHARDEGTVHVCEFERGRVFRAVHFPEPIDPDKVKAEFKNGMLRLTAPIAKAKSAKRVDIRAA